MPAGRNDSAGILFQFYHHLQQQCPPISDANPISISQFPGPARHHIGAATLGCSTSLQCPQYLGQDSQGRAVRLLAMLIPHQHTTTPK